jgi:uncharacterized membrane protein YfcA
MLFLILAGFAAGFIDAIVGGAGLISLPALLALGLPPHLAMGSTKPIGISTAIAGSLKYIHSKSVKWEGMKLAIPLAFIGAICGVLLISTFSNETLKHIIFYGLIIIAVFLMVNKKFGLMEKKKIFSIHSLWIVSLIIGMYDGFFGPGTGTFLVIALIHMFGYSFLPASATGRILNLASNTGSLLMFWRLGWIDFHFVFPGMIAAFVGGLLGATYSVKYGSKGIRPILFIVVFGLIIKLGMGIFLK